MPFSAEKDDYLLFIGRMTADKGAHTAIDVAHRLGRRLIMAGKVNEGPEHEYFAAEVEPHLSDKIHFRGEVDHETKVGSTSVPAAPCSPSSGRSRSASS